VPATPAETKTAEVFCSEVVALESVKPVGVELQVTDETLSLSFAVKNGDQSTKYEISSVGNCFTVRTMKSIYRLNEEQGVSWSVETLDIRANALGKHSALFAEELASA
jgi:hypothetical protein